MSATMNGKPMWCRPAPTRDFEFATAKEEPSSLLAEARKLVAAGIRAGLVKRAEPETVKYVSCKLRSARSVLHKCDRCGENFSRGHLSQQTRCFACRLPEYTCKWCQKQFQPRQRKAVVCSLECKHAIAKDAAQKRAEANGTRRPLLECEICKTPYRQRFTGGKISRTCGRECGIKLMVKTRKAGK